MAVDQGADSVKAMNDLVLDRNRGIQTVWSYRMEVIRDQRTEDRLQDRQNLDSYGACNALGSEETGQIRHDQGERRDRERQRCESECRVR